jgi:hypothetical protein
MKRGDCACAGRSNHWGDQKTKAKRNWMRIRSGKNSVQAIFPPTTSAGALCRRAEPRPAWWSRTRGAGRISAALNDALAPELFAHRLPVREILPFEPDDARVVDLPARKPLLRGVEACIHHFSSKSTRVVRTRSNPRACQRIAMKFSANNPDGMPIAR